MAPSGDGRVTVRRSLLSVDDKRGLADLGQALLRHRVEVLATQSTRRFLESQGIPTRPAEELTGIGSWFGGRIKTLHPGILGGILAPRTPDGAAELEQRRLLPIDLVVANLYPYARHLAEDPRADDREEYIDIGGSTLLRAAAKNHAAVTVASDPSEYGEIIAELDAYDGGTTAALRERLAVAAFRRTALYDDTIARTLLLGPSTGEGSDPFPEEIVFARDATRLRYGENPHQSAAAYRLTSPPDAMPRLDVEVVKGPSLSFTNLLDLETALGTVAEFPTPSAAVVKHATPCGVASGATLGEAIERAVATDPIARYGCVIAVNRPLAPGDESALRGVFVDLIAAPDIPSEVAVAFERRPKLKVVRAAPPPLDRPRWEAHSAAGRLLLQEADRRELVPSDFRAVTSSTASGTEACSLDFAWRVVRHAKSNAVVLAQGSTTVGIGSGQPTRVKAVELAVEVAGARAKGAVLASDAFFPFPDGVEIAGAAGVRAILQPGGSVRDAEVIAVAEKFGIAMYFTGWRVFRH
ncbi:MAG: bifunctional phosphoribosylaminoimidazolecarboxamide formyltransferase/IMP cyclohydrolase [Thermoplasmata archaeon]